MALKELDAHPELRDDPSLKDFNDLPTLAKSYRETKAFVGSSIRTPGPDASPEAKAEFYKKLQTHAPDLVPLREGDAEAEKLVWSKLGRPGKRDEYVFEVPKDVPLDIEALRDAAETAGLTKAQFQKMAAKTVQGLQTRQLASSKDRDALKAEWGTAYETKLKNAAALAQQAGLPEATVGAIMAGKLTSEQLKVWDFFATAIGSERGELGKQNGNTLPNALTPAEAQARFREVQAHPAYFNRNHPEHEVYVEKGKKLMEALHPG